MFPSMLQFIFLGAVFEVLKELIYNAVWVRTPYSLVHGYECSPEDCSGCIFTTSQKIEVVCPDGNLGFHRSGHMSPQPGRPLFEY
jgi:hypothetical protein